MSGSGLYRARAHLLHTAGRPRHRDATVPGRGGGDPGDATSRRAFFSFAFRCRHIRHEAHAQPMPITWR
ncbi:hypothetical protein FMEAI12_2140013 [Parafrankia sp. Ea1.12]|nr:hypothetical protein FMEAI12_2140013 [Parafrankia sp. Ea1.12]